ncbi:MAG: ABC transporter ATP-binding protein [Beijerinckiaceae bacterium]|jgi:branched-chain amino acid transport system ATP-binding protein|nr:ABC transporter ATP-binding protein [Beijerinckiaceae bacterium]
MLSARGLTKHFGGVVVADSLDIDLNPGEIVALIGPNGAGKTTLFNMLTGFVRPDAGSIVFDGQRVEKLPSHQRARLGLARTWQRPRLFESLSLVDNLMIADRDYPGERLIEMVFRPQHVLDCEEKGRERAERLLDRIGLGARAEGRSTRLSYGQQKLVGLARALMNDGRCILLDEPMAGVEGRTVETMKTVVRDEAAAGKAVCIVEHNIGFIRDICDRAIFMFNGRIVAEGSVHDLLADKRLTALYFGSHS